MHLVLLKGEPLSALPASDKFPVPCLSDSRSAPSSERGTEAKSFIETILQASFSLRDPDSPRSARTVETDGNAQSGLALHLGARTNPIAQPMPRTFHRPPKFLKFPKTLQSFLKANFSSKFQLLSGMKQGGPGRKACRGLAIFSAFPFFSLSSLSQPYSLLNPHSSHCSWQGASIVPADSGLPSFFSPRGGDPQQPLRVRTQSPLLAPPGPGKW